LVQPGLKEQLETRESKAPVQVALAALLVPLVRLALKALPETRAPEARRWLVLPDPLAEPALQECKAQPAIRGPKAAPPLVWLVHPDLPVTGAPGPAGVINRWTAYRDFRFDSNQTDLQTSQTNKVSEIALYLKANPSLKLGIDGSMQPRNQELSDQRVSSIRNALIDAGVPTSRIQTGAFGDKNLPHDGRVNVLIRTATY
jgi:outer membrane protein OmpA-like peptidoglycan-associated protein